MKFKVGAIVNCKWTEEVIEASCPQDAIDQFKAKHGQIHIVEGSLNVEHEIVEGVWV